MASLGLCSSPNIIYFINQSKYIGLRSKLWNLRRVIAYIDMQGKMGTPRNQRLQNIKLLSSRSYNL